MAKLIGPLHSDEARGQFAKTVVYNRRRGQNIARAYVRPSNPNTLLQQASRIILGVAGVINRAINGQTWMYATETVSWSVFLTTKARVGQVWGSVISSRLIGTGHAFYTTAMAEYVALTDPQKLLWKTAAELVTTGLSDYVVGETTVESGFQLFVAEKAVQVEGYGPAFDPLVPHAIS